MRIWVLFFWFFCLGVLNISCTSDELPEPESCVPDAASYDQNVKDIIDNSCAYTGCHDGAGGIGPGNYNTYAGLRPILENGLFKSRVLDLRSDPVIGMPPSSAVYPQTQKEELTSQELELIRCWLNNGYPEK